MNGMQFSFTCLAAIYNFRIPKCIANKQECGEGGKKKSLRETRLRKQHHSIQYQYRVDLYKVSYCVENHISKSIS